MAVVTMRDLLEAGVHFGHQTSRWNPKMKPYIFGQRNGIHIINLQKTLTLFREAVSFVQRVVSRGDSVLFVGTKRQAQDVIMSEAKRARMPYVTQRWLGGMLTNFQTIRKSLERIDRIEKLLAEGSVERLPKKEVLILEKERNKLLKNLGGVREMKRLPGVVFVVDPRKEHICVNEARKLSIPVVGLADTNCDPDELDYLLPGNDDAIRAIRLFTAAVADACVEGYDMHKDQLVRGHEKPTAAATMDDEGAIHDKGLDEADQEVEVIRKPRRS